MLPHELEDQGVNAVEAVVDATHLPATRHQWWKGGSTVTSFIRMRSIVGNSREELLLSSVRLFTT